MVLEAQKIPSLLFWFLIMGLTTYVTFKIAGKVKEQVSTTLR